MVWLTFLPAPEGQPVKRLRCQIHGAKQEKINPKEEGSQKNMNGKIPEGQVYAPRPEPTAPIRLADRNHAHYPSRHCTIFKKRRLNDRLPAHAIRSTRESSEMLHVLLTHLPPRCALTFFFPPAPEGQPVKRFRRQIHGAKQEKINPKEEGS